MRLEPSVAESIGPTTIGDFTRRASIVAATTETRCLEIGVRADCLREPCDPQRFESIAIPPHQAASSFPGFVSMRPIDPLPTESEHFGLILCLGVLERVNEPHGFMAEVSRILEDGGQLYFTAPLIVERLRPDAPGRQRIGLNCLVDAAGLQIEDLRPVERSTSYALIGTRKRRPAGQV